MWFRNGLHPRATTNKFHYNKYGIIQIGIEVLSQTQIPNIPKQLSHKYKPKNQRFTNTKYEYQIPIRIAHKPKREPQIKFKSCNTPRESKSPNHKTKTNWQQTPLTIPNYNPQISNNQKRESLFFSHHTHSQICRIALCLYKRLKSASMSKTNKDQTFFSCTKEESFQIKLKIQWQTRLLIKFDNFK